MAFQGSCDHFALDWSDQSQIRLGSVSRAGVPERISAEDFSQRKVDVDLLA